MAGQIQINYEEMRGIIQRMKSSQQEVENIYRTTKQKVDALHANQWIGKGSDQFFREMEEKVLPGLRRLAAALGTAAEKAQKICDTIRQADESTKSFFSNLG